MLVLKSLSSHADLVNGVPKYAMVVGSMDGDHLDKEVELDPDSYVTLLDLCNAEMAAHGPPEPPTRRPGPPTEDEVELLERELRRMEQDQVAPPLSTGSPEELLESVGFYRTDGLAGGELMETVGADDDDVDPGETTDVDDDDGVGQY